MNNNIVTEKENANPTKVRGNLCAKKKEKKTSPSCNDTIFVRKASSLHQYSRCNGI